ncbi:Guanylate kinase [Aquicella siphonis]|uniref:Guanylate kinase n=1 Tax=Aquicella siphonis TaxID=254247 RepID=A0A5E4PDM8_9COXI|nr:guanylate kinase [Aquicella siphonis]VVC75040.1 Guanylate kinase [Aquicella siphonis]
MAETGNLYIIAAPSGAGKTSLVKAVVDSIPKITVSISHTTRPKRPGETHGVNYYFVDNMEFQRMIEHHDFLEHAMIFGNQYGTSKSWVEKTLAQGMDVILEIDWQGQQQIKRLFPQSTGIFILPPSLNDLQDRLIKRNQDHPEVIKKRLADVQETVSHIHEFDYVVVNDEFSRAQHDITVIIEAGRLVQKRQASRYAKLIDELVTIRPA